MEYLALNRGDNFVTNTKIQKSNQSNQTKLKWYLQYKINYYDQIYSSDHFFYHLNYIVMSVNITGLYSNGGVSVDL